MKAAILDRIGDPLRIGEVDTPSVGPNDVLVATKSCGICRTDIHIQDGLAYIPSLPHVPGHEPAGTVAAVGSNVKHLRVGDRVVPHLFLTCGECAFCQQGDDAQCVSIDGIIGVTCGGGFAEYFTAPAKNLLSLPQNVPFDVGGLVSCAVITAVHAYARSRVTANETAVILGAGGIGQILIQLLRHHGVKVIAWSRSAKSLEIATQLGADLTIPLGDETSLNQIKEFTNQAGVDCVFECVGVSETMSLAGNALRPRGRIVVIGEEADPIPLNTIEVAQRELEIIGSRNGSKQDAAKALRFMSEGVIDPPIFARFPLAEINQALDLVRGGKAHGRVVIEFD